MENKARPNQSFTQEDLLKGQIHRNQFQIDYLPMWHFLDRMDEKIPNGLKSLELKRVFEGIYEFATIQVSLDKNEMQTRIDNLNEQNLKWHTKAMDLEAQLAIFQAKEQVEPTEISPFESAILSENY